MAHRLELAAKVLAFERVATGGFVVIAPGRAIGALATPGYDTEAARYVTRLLGIRQVVLGVMLWHSRGDRAWLRRMATLNALTEALDAVATLVAVVQPRGALGVCRVPRQVSNAGRRGGTEGSTLAAQEKLAPTNLRKIKWGSYICSTTPALAQDIADQAGCRNGGQDRKRALHKGFLHIVFRPALFRLVQKLTCELGRRPRRQRGG